MRSRDFGLKWLSMGRVSVPSACSGRHEHLRCWYRVAGYPPLAGSAGHAGATANLKLTFHLDHSAGADQRNALLLLGPTAGRLSFLMDAKLNASDCAWFGVHPLGWTGVMPFNWRSAGRGPLQT